MSQEVMANLYDTTKQNISYHLNNIFKEKELDKNSVVKDFLTTASDSKKYNVLHYNLDAIIAVGYRINSKKATEFRMWATRVLKEYMTKGFALNDERFLKAKKSDQEYFKRLLERIKLIRTSERMFYQKITDIFAECSIDYDKNSDTAITFYKTIQNKFHYAITGNTAAEIVYKRVDSKKENMGLTTWENSPDGKILKSDVIIAKNYLNEQEIKNLNNLVNLFLDIAENNAERSITMYMEDWKDEVENSLKVFHYEVLEGKGKISHKQAVEKAFPAFWEKMAEKSGSNLSQRKPAPVKGLRHFDPVWDNFFRKYTPPLK
jgi:hypothetical protein